jgi:hypothetical protein
MLSVNGGVGRGWGDGGYCNKFGKKLRGGGCQLLTLASSSHSPFSSLQSLDPAAPKFKIVTR